MGFTGLARWINAPTTGLELINDNIMRNHGGSYRGKWTLSVKSYRTIPNVGNMGRHMTSDRSMCAVTMNENVFVLLEDPSAPTRADIISAAAHASQAGGQQGVGGGTEDAAPSGSPANMLPPHYRTTYITVTPPHSLELLLAQLRARWQSVRQAAGQARGQTSLGAGGVQLVIEGNVFAIGSDWLVRAGNVVLAGGTVRGMLLEAEYLPLHVMPVQSADGTSELLSNLLTSLLPRVPDAKTVAVTIPPGQWEEVLYSGESAEMEGECAQQLGDEETQEEVLDDVYVYGVPPPRARKGDWQGIDRDRRAAFLIIGRMRLILGAKRGSYCCHYSAAPAPALSGPLHFYRNRQLDVYAARSANPLTLRQLVFFGRLMNEERIIKSANYVRTELPVRIAHRLRDMQALPYIVVTREGVAKVYELYWSAFDKLRRYPQINSLKDNEAFCAFLKGLLDEHLPVIPNLYLGLSLASRHLLPEQLDAFMRRMLVSRISRRVLAEHHLALSASFGGQPVRGAAAEKTHHADNVGIIYTNLCVKSSIEHCVALLRSCPRHVVVDKEPVERGAWPEVVIDGHEDTRFSYIKEHLEYIVFELLKNALRFTIMHCGDRGRGAPVPTIRATIVTGPDDVSIRISDQGGGLSMNTHVQSPSDLFSFSHVRNTGRLEDVRIGALRHAISSAKGIKGTVGEQVAEDPPEEPRGESLDVSREIRERTPRRIGIGLPMSNIYAGYFGGSLQLVPMDGWGTDVYVRLPKLGTNLEGIEV